MRKDLGFKVNDRISVRITPHNDIDDTLLLFKNYICNETLATDIVSMDSDIGEITDINGIEIKININKV